MAEETIEQVKDKLLMLIREDAYFRQKITLSSGKASDYYIDARRVTLSAQGAYLCARMILDLVGDDSVDAIGGPTLGADPMLGAVGVLSLQAQKPVNAFIIRKAAKAHGKQQQIEGPPLKAGSRVVLIDDVATTGRAFVESIDVLRAMGIQPQKAICIVDRDEGAREAVAQKGCELISVFKIAQIHT